MQTPAHHGHRLHGHGAVIREDFCSFCGGTDAINKQGVQETMVSCAACGRSGHPTCLNMLTPKLRKRVMMYDWHCIECKTCEQCAIKGDDVSTIISSRKHIALMKVVAVDVLRYM